MTRGDGGGREEYSSIVIIISIITSSLMLKKYCLTRMYLDIWYVVTTFMHIPEHHMALQHDDLA